VVGRADCSTPTEQRCRPLACNGVTLNLCQKCVLVLHLRLILTRVTRHAHARTRTPLPLHPAASPTLLLAVLPAIKSARGPNRSYVQSRGEPSLVQPSPAPVQVRVKGGMGQQLAAPSGEADYAMQAGADRSQLQSRGSSREAAMPKVPEENAAE
jgi:hypothetical protein